MPAGASWGQYLRYTATAMLTMFAGAQVVHLVYRPLDDIDKYIAEELERIENPSSESKTRSDDKS